MPVCIPFASLSPTLPACPAPAVPLPEQQTANPLLLKGEESHPMNTKNDFSIDGGPLDITVYKPNPDISSAPYRIYNIGNNSPVQLLDFIETLEKAIGIEAKKNFLPMQAGDVVSTYADVSDLIEDFDYKPDTKLDDGIKEFVKWYKEFYKIINFKNIG